MAPCSRSSATLPLPHPCPERLSPRHFSSPQLLADTKLGNGLGYYQFEGAPRSAGAGPLLLSLPERALTTACPPSTHRRRAAAQGSLKGAQRARLWRLGATVVGSGPCPLQRTLACLPSSPVATAVFALLCSLPSPSPAALTHPLLRLPLKRQPPRGDCHCQRLWPAPRGAHLHAGRSRRRGHCACPHVPHVCHWCVSPECLVVAVSGRDCILIFPVQHGSHVAIASPPPSPLPQRPLQEARG